MDILSASLLPVASLRWQPRPSAWAFTAVCKATYVLAPGESPLAPEMNQKVIHEADEHWEDDRSRSVIAPSDLVPVKPRAEVMLVGSAYAPGRSQVRSLITRLVVGDIDKAIEVLCDRTASADGTIQEGAPFSRMPLRYERAAGGQGTTNPVGVRPDNQDPYGRRALPNLKPPGAPRGPDELIEPINFGPLGAAWPTRAEKLGRLAAGFSMDSLRDKPLPEGIDLEFFNQAPQDQRLSALRDNERIVLENLHPEHPRLITRLPGIRPAAFVDRGRGVAARLPMRPDTLWLDTDRGIATLTWRGQFPLENPEEPGRVLIGMEPPGVELSFKDIERLAVTNTQRPASRPQPVMTLIPGVTGGPAPGEGEAARPVLPFAQGQQRRDPPSERSGQTPVAGLPFQGAAPRSSNLSMLAMAAPSPISAPIPSSSPAPSPPPSAPPALVEAGSVLAASNAAASKSAPYRPPRPELIPGKTPAEIIPEPSPRGKRALRLIWFDLESPPRIRRVSRFKPILDALEDRPRDRDADDPAVERDPLAAEDRREVIEIMTRASATGAKGVAEALDGAVRDDGRMVTPLVLVEGEASFPFDELESLKAAVGVAGPLVSTGDEDLRASLDIAKEYLKMPAHPPSVSQSLLTRIRDAFAREKRGLPADYLETQMDRLLLTERHYQTRTLLGEAYIRFFLRPPGDEPLLAYLPEKARKLLPIYKAFACRALCEVLLPEDQYETQPQALRVLALVRVGELAPKP